MTAQSNKDAAEIRRLRALHPEMRERDFARIHAISEAELIAAEVGRSVVRLRPDVALLLNGLTRAGEVMALTRNESAVHEKIGPYETVTIGEMASMVLGAQIDLRIFPSKWAFGFAVEKPAKDGAMRRSMQFFDAQGLAIHKIHARPATDLEAWTALITSLRHAEQSDTIVTMPLPEVAHADVLADVAALRQHWQAMTDTHQFFGLLKQFNLQRLTAVELVGIDLAWRLDVGAVLQMFGAVAGNDLPIMAFVSNGGCTQIHSGPITTVQPMGPWLNVMDDTFHLHVRVDQIASVWAVRRPTGNGHVTAVEVYDGNRDLIIQFFGKRQEGSDERALWRTLVEDLPRYLQSDAA